MQDQDDAVKMLNLRLDELSHRRTAETSSSVRSLKGESIFRLRKSLERQSGEAAV
jgi:hypothetical protein